MTELRRSTATTLLIYFAAFASGVSTMALQMLLGRTLVPYFGGTVYTWGSLISVFLLGMSVGYWGGGMIADRRPSSRMIGIAFVSSAAYLLLLPRFSPYVINLCLDNIEDIRYSALAASMLLAALPAGILATVSPTALRLLVSSTQSSGGLSGRLSALATVGCIVGTLGTSFLLIPSLGVNAIYTWLAVFTGTVGLALLANGRLAFSGKPALLFILPLVCIFSSQPAAAEVVETIDSEYNTIIIEREGTVVSMNFGYRNNRYVESAMDASKPKELIVPYTRNMTTALAYMTVDPTRVAMIGLGGGRTIGYVVENVPTVTAEVAEIDPAVIAAAEKYFALRKGTRMRVHAKDGRVFLRASQTPFDIVFLDAYRGPFVPFHLTTKEFYELVASKLKPGGVVAQNVEPTTLLLDSTLVTMRSVFDNVDVHEGSGNYVLIGYFGDPISDAELHKRAEVSQLSLHLPYDLRGLVKARGAAPEVKHGTEVLTDDFAPVEMLRTIPRHNQKRK